MAGQARKPVSRDNAQAGEKIKTQHEKASSRAEIELGIFLMQGDSANQRVAVLSLEGNTYTEREKEKFKRV